MKGIQKKILLAGFAAIFAFIVTIGSTYAWFTVTSANQVQAVTLNIETADSLLIMLDDPTANTNAGYIYDADHDKATLDNPANYKTVISSTDIAAYYTMADFVMTPVTTTDGTSFTNRAGSSVSGNILVTMSFWVMSQSKSANIAVHELTLSANNGTPIKNTVVDAIRFSVTSPDDGTKVFGKDKLYSFDDGGTLIDSADEAAITLLHGVYYTAGTAVAGESTATLSSATTTFDLAPDTPEKITIRIWIEGWDDECTNNLIAAVFDIGFGFRIKP